MTVEKDIIMSLLKLTQNGSAGKNTIVKDARVPVHVAHETLKKLSQKDFFFESEGVIDISPNQRVKLAVQALSLTADFERVCNLLSWKEFEHIAAEALEANSYQVLRNLHFTQASKRWEIDVIGLKKPLILCADCKHWKRGLRKAATAKIVEAQTERTKAFAKVLPNYSQKARLEGWETATIIPIIMSLTLGSYKIYDDVPIVPVLQFQDFINELPAHAHLLKSFTQKQLKMNTNLQNFC